mmetsp:Transcript_9139/g.26676  ORF Transcript_9139/g.26676 Transcript_9139/m.26676 type:complete len:420 (+) Transcript_9139:648-1907(+)
MHTHAFRLQLGLELIHGGRDGGGVLRAGLAHGHDDNLRRRHLRREHEALVIGVRHDERADEPRAHAPARRPNHLALALLVLELHIEGLGEILAKEVRGATLQCPAILHERLDGVRLHGAGEALRRALGARRERHGEQVLHYVGVHLQHFAGGGVSLLGRGVRRVALLPEELGAAQERPRAHLPAHDVGPLVKLQRQVAVRANPLAEHVPDHGLRGGPHDEGLLELGVRIGHHLRAARLLGLEAVVRHDGGLHGEALDVLRLLAQEARGDEEREVGVLRAAVEDAAVEGLLEAVPDAHAPRADDHAALDGRRVDHVGGGDDVLVPERIVLVARRDVVRVALLGVLAAPLALLLLLLPLLLLLLLLLPLVGLRGAQPDGAAQARPQRAARRRERAGPQQRGAPSHRAGRQHGRHDGSAHFP